VIKGKELSKVYSELTDIQLLARLEEYQTGLRVEPYLDGYYTDLIFLTKRELRKRNVDV
jgi:hypothetical protein